ncbi:MAG: reverse transcriptase domain-containing protein [Aeromonas sp.]
MTSLPDTTASLPRDPLTSLTALNPMQQTSQFLMTCHKSDRAELKILHINARSLKPKIGLLRTLIEIYAIDVVLICETWCTQKTRDIDISLPGYQLIRTDRSHGHGGGCAVYIHERHPADLVTLDFIHHSIEATWFSILIARTPTLIGCVYIPPGNTKSIDDINTLFHTLSCTPYNSIFICGDFNLPDINWISPTCSPKFKPLLETLKILGWTQHVTSPTRGSNILDLVFSCNIQNVVTIIGPKFPGSDHRMLLSTIPHSPSTTTHLQYTRRLRCLNWNTFNELNATTDWNSMLQATNPSTAATTFKTNILRILNNVAPLVPISPRPTFNQLRIPAKLKSKLERLKKKYRISLDPTLLKSINTILDHHMMQTAEQVKRNEEEALKSSNAVENLVHILKKHSPIQHPLPRTILTANCTQLSEPIEICTAFNEHFAATLQSHPDNDLFELTSMSPNNHTQENGIHIEFSSKNIKQAISALKTSTFPGPDGLPSMLFKQSDDFMHTLLEHLFRLSLTTGVFPDEWKHSIITPKYKGGIRHQIENYRPIHHTSITSRIMEKVIKKELMIHIEAHQLIHPSQHGFLNKKSCNTCMISFLNKLTRAHDTGHSALCIYLDIHKAFDQVPHSKLLSKLHAFGIDSGLHRWLESYLTNRTQQVQIGTHLSGPLPITSGVIQGSVLGPILFLLYINDISTSIKHGDIFIFADDCKLLYTFPKDDLSLYLQQIQSDLNRIETWSSDWELQFSVNKCKILPIRCYIPQACLSLQSQAITIATSIRDLGIHYSSALKFNEHASIQVVRAGLQIRRINKFIINPTAKLILYKSCVRPGLDYGSFIHSHMNEKDRKLIESIQRRFTKQLQPNLSYRQRCLHFKLEPLWLRRVKLNLNILRDIIKNPNLIGRASIITNPVRTLRNNRMTMLRDTPKTKHRENFFLNCYSRIWNKLPEAIRSASNKYAFKKQLDTILTPEHLHSIYSPYNTIDFTYENGLRNT